MLVRGDDGLALEGAHLVEDGGGQRRCVNLRGESRVAEAGRKLSGKDLWGM